MSTVWIEVTESEHHLMRALLNGTPAKSLGKRRCEALRSKLERTNTFPDITVGVHGGQVQWARGNPFPIRVCDYDGDRCDLTAVDRWGHPCRTWFEPADNNIAQ